MGLKTNSWVCWHRNWCTRWHPTASNRSPCVHGGGCEWKLEAYNCLLFHWWPQWRWPGECGHTVSVPPLWHRCHCDVNHLWWGINNLGHISWTGRTTGPECLSLFSYHANNTHKVHKFLDVCHLLKLTRSTLASQTITDGDDKHWQYIVEMHKLQEGEGRRAANKLRTPHIDWRRKKMKVNLASQVLSSTGTAFGTQLVTVRGCKATAFLQNLWPFVRYLEFAQFTRQNFQRTNGKTFSSTVHSQAQGTLMIHTNRKTAFVGFLTAIKTVTALFTSGVVPLRHLRHVPPQTV